MAYDLHITRQEIHFHRKDEFEISEKDWNSLLESHPELEPVDSIKENGMELTLNNTKIAKWTTSTGKNVWFKFYKGNITVVGPDDETVKKMKEIASVIGAKVQGDDGEFY